MKRQRFFLLFAFLVLLAAFLVGKLSFTLYNRNVEALSFMQFLTTWARGLLLDAHTAAILLLIPALCTLQQRVSLRWLLVPYFILVAIVIASVTAADIVMYEFWEFKLSSVILSYAASPEGMTSSVPTSFITTRFTATIVYILSIALSLAFVTPKRTAKSWLMPLVILVLALLPVGVSTCYSSSQSLFRNHAATNSIYAFVSSFWQDRRYDDFFAPEQCQGMTASLYPADTEDITDTLLNMHRPNILVVQMESFGAKFVSELGGVPDVAVNLSRLIPDAVFFNEYYSNSFRTDRGTVSLQSGTISHPTVSLMKEKRHHPSLQSLPRRLAENGYETCYFYAGWMTNMGKRDYLNDMGFGTLYDMSVFADESPDSPWGMHDGKASMKLLQILEQQDTLRPWYCTLQLLSSHEPWEVPYHRLADERLNAFAYTDQCVGDLVDSLRASPLWERLLLIVIPDHGYLYEQTYEDPEFFRAPMLWLGGALRQPLLVSTLMNQSDIAATLLSQLGIPHTDFPWSRNVFSRNYTHPFVYCNSPSVIMLRDSTGFSIFDLSASRPIKEQPETGNEERTNSAKAILQRSYELLREHYE